MHDDRRQDVWRLVYDDDCGFCKWTVSLIMSWDRDGRLAPCPIQGALAQELLSDLSPEARLASMHLVAPSGERFSAGPAIAPLLGLLPKGHLLALGVSRVPRFTPKAYDWVASHRSQLSRAVPGRAKSRASARLAAEVGCPLP